MKTPPIVVTLLMTMIVATPASAELKPNHYKATVVRAKADVFSGPGGQYYRTGVLTEGTTVEVHRTAGGYLGVRPPEGSFSWAPGDDLQEVEPGIAEVQRDGVPSRVGSLLTEDRNVVHIRLAQGERVRVLSRTMIDGAEWAQIAPPAGEFRWVRAEDVSTGSFSIKSSIAVTPVEPVVEEPIAATQAVEEASSEVVIEAPTEKSVEPAPFAAEATPLSEWIQVERVQAASHAEPAGDGGEAPPFEPAPMQQAPVQPAPVQPETGQPAPAQPMAGQAIQPPIAPEPLASGGSFEQQLASLEMELSRRVTQPANLWRLDDIGAGASRLLASAQGPEQHNLAQSLMARTNRFAAIAVRQRLISGSAPPVARTKVTPFASAPSAVTPLPSTNPLPSTTEVTGELRPVVSKREDAPKFALVDASGRVTTFLSPQPGMQLEPLVGKQVSVAGVQAYLPAIRHQHIAATRVAQATATTNTR